MVRAVGVVVGVIRVVRVTCSASPKGRYRAGRAPKNKCSNEKTHITMYTNMTMKN